MSKPTHGFRSSETFTILVVCVAVFADVLLQNLVVPVLPYALKDRVGLVDEADIQRWNALLLAAFGGAFMSGSFLFGAIADRISTRRTPFIFGLLLSFASTLCFALGATLPILLCARLLEGFSAAIVATVGYALMRDVVGQDRLGRAMGFTSMSLGMALLLGPVVGGVLYEYAGYFETFLPALALITVEIGLRVLLIETVTRVGKGSRRKTGRTDEEEAREDLERSRAKNADVDTETATTPHPPVLIPTTPSTTQHPNDPHNTELEPLLPPSPAPHPTKNVYYHLLTDPRFLTSLTALFILHSTANGFDAVLPPYINTAFSLGPTHCAILFLALAIPTLFSPLTGLLTDRLGPKPVAATGLAIAASSLTTLGLIGPATAAPMAHLFVNLFVVGIALALSLVPLTVAASAVVGSIEAERPGVFGPGGAYARAFGLVNAVVAAGGLVGPLGAGALRVSFGWRGWAWVMGGLCLGACAAVVLVAGDEERDKGDAVGGGDLAVEE